VPAHLEPKPDPCPVVWHASCAGTSTGIFNYIRDNPVQPLSLTTAKGSSLFDLVAALNITAADERVFDTLPE